MYKTILFVKTLYSRLFLVEQIKHPVSKVTPIVPNKSNSKGKKKVPIISKRITRDGILASLRNKKFLVSTAMQIIPPKKKIELTL